MKMRAGTRRHFEAKPSHTPPRSTHLFIMAQRWFCQTSRLAKMTTAIPAVTKRFIGSGQSVHGESAERIEVQRICTS